MGDCVNTFMEIRAPKIDPSWRTSDGNKFAEKQRQRQASKKARERTNSFKSLMNDFIDRTQRTDLKWFNVDHKFRWEDVKEMAADAVDRDVEKTKWRKNPLRAAARSFQRNASNLEMLLAFLPNGDFTGILCGALTLVFCAAKRLYEVRQKIFACLESLPHTVGQLDAYLEVYADEGSIWDAAEDLYLGILEGVAGMLQWIDKPAFERAYKVLLFPMTFGSDVEESAIKQNIEDRVARFRELATLGLHRNVASLRADLRDSNKSVEALRALLTDLVSYSQWAHENPRLAATSKTSFVTLEQLRSIVNVDAQLAKRDEDIAIMDAQNVCQPKLITKALSVLHNEKFLMWLQSNTSHILFINGRMKLSAAQEASSPLTILSCVVSQTVSMHNRRSIPMLYLCGQHNSPYDVHGGPNGIIRCLNSQLAHAVTQEDVDLSKIDMEFVEGIRTQTPQTLCSLFRLLLPAAMRKVVFVIIDGVSWMEEGPHARDFGGLVIFLQDIVNELNQRQPGFAVKVLLTNPSTSLHAHRWLPDDSILEMDDVEDYMDIPMEAERFLW
ncbi:hypothetical protein CGCF415_v008797 [Colletotrichum fructicola]|uniref:Uncharacterized protein n=1 Tax=Colletotrichum fructicola (strain Nara gc5) TaxID=1213859 RepID=L2G5A7_COLFN|nr:uncharacterized protein CGMCC3_g15338 [Colletotrichum fructicola]KAF4476117.1 hypothetical protein CGGC5_v015014 [Colletotrichum fructicola Nara gc5]KAE9568561.1 hypothetical protein CGMCC3_g15338 [Colletotrichum fructicola]KAF4420472.1 hypothetical protein CFRS1_v014990 [Colletotrichum fructicola]KAF4885536.1 hypothetical protein CGCFRS4_v011906 [Colletotrichum fructicola]KAF4904076.1 hypothetical protein CGCF415_v008797 [Colletotrichum fructicola]